MDEGSSAGERPEDYEAIRRRLQERGYLVGHVGRFVLLPRVPGRTIGRGILGPAARAAIVSGPLLAALLAALLAWSERPLERASDLPLFWLYLLVPASVAVLVFDFAAALVVAALLGRRGARSAAADPTRAAVVTSVLAFLYLLALWRTRAGGGPLVEDLFFVLLAIPAVVAIGHLASLVSLAGVVHRTGDVPVARRGRLGIVIAGVVVVGSLALATRPLLVGDAEPGVPEPFPVLGGSGRVVVLGIDGLDADLLAGLAERGALVGLLQTLEEGSTFPMRRVGTSEPAEVWTTIATGLPGRMHGVHGAQADRLAGVGTTLRGALPLWEVWRSLLPLRAVPTTRGIRRAPAVWEIAASHLGTAVVGWWATWPAPLDESHRRDSRVRYVLTDRVLAKLLAGSPFDRDASPSALFERLKRAFPAEVARLRGEFTARFAGEDSQGAAWAWESLLIDAFACERVAELMSDPDVELAYAYLPGLDILRVRLTSSFDPDRTELLELYAEALEARLLSILTSPRLTTVVVADPGRSAAAEGFVSVRGPSARAACVGSPLTELDMAPLVLRLLGFPRSLEMPGRAPESCFERPAVPLGSVPSYGRLPPAERRTSSASDPEILDRLRSLGYLR